MGAALDVLVKVVAQEKGEPAAVAARALLKEAAERSWRNGELRRAAHQAIAEIQSRLKDASPGQLSLTEAETGQLSLTQDEGGQLSLAGEPGGQLSLSADEEEPKPPSGDAA